MSNNDVTTAPPPAKRRKVSKADNCVEDLTEEQSALARQAVQLYCSTLVMGHRFTVEGILKQWSLPANTTTSSVPSSDPAASSVTERISALCKQQRVAVRRFLNKYFGRNDNAETQNIIVHVAGTSDYVCIRTAECQLCMESMAAGTVEHALYPCLHRGVCSSCVTMLQTSGSGDDDGGECPWCKTAIKDVIDMSKLVEQRQQSKAMDFCHRSRISNVPSAIV